MIKAVISKVLTRLLAIYQMLIFYKLSANSIAPIAPQPAASVGVAKPNNILPSAANTNAAGGTKPRKNSIQTCFILVALISSGKTGPRAWILPTTKCSVPSI